MIFIILRLLSLLYVGVAAFIFIQGISLYLFGKPYKRRIAIQKFKYALIWPLMLHTEEGRSKLFNTK